MSLISNIGEIIKENILTCPKALVNSIFVSGIYYGITIILVDVYGFKYYSVGLLVLPLIFFLQYFINKYWVFKNQPQHLNSRGVST